MDIIPDYIIETFYKIIKFKFEEGLKEDDILIQCYLNNLIKLNGKLPDKINKLLHDYRTK